MDRAERCGVMRLPVPRMPECQDRGGRAPARPRTGGPDPPGPGRVAAAARPGPHRDGRPPRRPPCRVSNLGNFTQASGSEGVHRLILTEPVDFSVDPAGPVLPLHLEPPPSRERRAIVHDTSGAADVAHHRKEPAMETYAGMGQQRSVETAASQRARGKAARREVPRAAHAVFTPGRPRSGGAGRGAERRSAPGPGAAAARADVGESLHVLSWLCRADGPRPHPTDGHRRPRGHLR